MKTVRYAAASIALLLAGCESSDDRLPAEGGAEVAPLTAAREQLANRVWTQMDSAGLPGVMRIFLTDGTLVQDSCWETHRLSLWRMRPDGGLEWSEDGQSISADVVTLGDSELTLRLHLVGGDEEQRYVAAPVPYLCPDVPR